MKSIHLLLVLFAVLHIRAARRFHSRRFNKDASLQEVLALFPPIDPLVVPPLEYNINSSGIKVNVKIHSNVVLTGLNGLTFESFQETDGGYGVVAAIHVPYITVNADNYQLKGTAYKFIPLSGHGKLWIKLHDLRATVTVKLSPSGGGSVIDHISATLKAGKVEGNLENSSWVINKSFSIRGPKIFAENSDQIVEKAKEIFLPYLADPLATMGPQEIIALVKRITEC